LYHLAFFQGDIADMQQQVAWAAGKSGAEDMLLSAQSDTEAYYGRLQRAREFSQRAVDSARRADAVERAALWQVNAALREAEFGKLETARQAAATALAPSRGRDVQLLAALALAQAGEIRQSQLLAQKLVAAFPLSTPLQSYWLPLIRAKIELAHGNADAALKLLETASPYEFGEPPQFQIGTMYPIYVRGQAYLLAHRDREAAAEFQKVLSHKGLVLNFSTGSLAHLGLARAYALSGESARARVAYEDFSSFGRTRIPKSRSCGRLRRST
jgi:hypothetical protein